MSSYQERQLLCGLTSSRRDSGALSKVLTIDPVRTASEGHAVQAHRPMAVDNYPYDDVVDEVACSLSLMSAILSWKLSISENIVLYNCALKHDNRTLEQSSLACLLRAASACIFAPKY